MVFISFLLGISYFIGIRWLFYNELVYSAKTRRTENETKNEYENNGIRLFAECNLIIVNLFSKSIRTKESRSVDGSRSRRYCLSTLKIALNGYQLYFLHSKP